MNLFQIDIAKSFRKTYGRNKVTDKWELQSKLEDNNTSPIINIESTSLLNIKSGYDISNFTIQKQYSTFDDKNKWFPKRKTNPNLSFLYKKEIMKVTESPIVIFNLLRTYGEPIYSKNNEFITIKERNIWKNIKAPESFILNKTTLNLVSIVVHTGGAHYVCNFKFMNDWYWYDDSPFEQSNNIKKIGKYSDMINTKPNPLTNGTIFIYVKDDI
jgi:ubiquitin C-terminal hydrolase